MMGKSIYGLIGYPLGHSLSRAFFMDKFLREGIDAEYLLWPLPELASRSDLPSEEGLRGFNVTIPYKQRVMEFLDEVDEVAERIGAVNVVKVEAPGKEGRRRLKGYNTDAEGFLQSLLAMPGFDVESHGSALVLGSGGASRAVAYALEKVGVKPVIVSRSGREGTWRYEDLDEAAMASHTLIVNCTPLGTYPDTDAAPPIPYHLVDSRHLCHDLVYNPPVTKFMELCAARGATVKNGAEMLRNQALEAWKIWNSPTDSAID